MVRVYSNEYYKVDVLHDEALIEIVRSRLPFVSMADMLASTDDMLRAINSAGAARYALLMDFRVAPPAKAGSYRKAFHKTLAHLCSRFRAIGIVVKTIESIEAERRLAPPGVHFFTSPRGAQQALRSMWDDVPTPHDDVSTPHAVSPRDDAPTPHEAVSRPEAGVSLVPRVRIVVG